MKSPMNMAPNKMKTPMKALSDLKDNLGTGENEIDPNSKFGKKIKIGIENNNYYKAPAYDVITESKFITDIVKKVSSVVQE